MTIRAPSEFRQVFLNMGDSFGEFAKTKKEYVLYALVGVDKKDAAVIKVFLDQILTSYDAEQLKAWWRVACITTYFKSGEALVEFLTIMRDILDKPPYHD